MIDEEIEEMKKTCENRHTVVIHVPLTQRADNVSFHTYYTTSKFVYFALIARTRTLIHAHTRTHVRIHYVFWGWITTFWNLPKKKIINMNSNNNTDNAMTWTWVIIQLLINLMKTRMTVDSYVRHNSTTH